MALALRVLRGRSLPQGLAVGSAVLAVGVAVGLLSAGQVAFAVPVAVALLLIGIASIDLTLVPLAAVVGTFAMMRVGGFVSASDVLLMAGVIVSLFLVRGRGMGSMQPLLMAGALYVSLALPTQIWRPYMENWIEWVHEVVLVLGAMVVGFALGREGRARAALTAYLVTCMVVGVWAAVWALASFARFGEFIPVYLYDLHKNTIGGMLAIGIVIAYARPPWMGWSRGWTLVAMSACWLGVAAAQSRQGIVAALIGMLVVALRPYVQGGHRKKLIWAVAGAATVVVAFTVNQQLAENNPFNSAQQRLAWYEESLEVWRQSPIFGNGLRWWYTPEFAGYFQPPNAELEVLTSVGIVGLIGFLGMFAMAVVALWKLPPVYGTVGLAVVVARFTQGQFDLYWVAGQAAVLWIVAGVCFGVRERDRAAVPPGASTAAPEPVGGRR